MGLLCCMSYMINQSRRRIKEKRLNKHLNNLLKYYNKFQIYILGIFFSFFPIFSFDYFFSHCLAKYYIYLLKCWLAFSVCFLVSF